ncbi:3'-5' exonuclease [Sphingomonas panaciterrae]|uniref:3'-5' exonuclease n=1 Tax=Sphingomonas panaciterrae TaxID=1462999 RepID=UPI002FF183D6
MRILFFDTETTGIPLWHDPSDDPRQPHVVELACELWDGDNQADCFHAVIDPGVPIPPEVAAIHGITDEIAQANGVAPHVGLDAFMRLIADADLVVGHNVSFDVRLMRIMAARHRGVKWDNPLPTFCTMRKSTNICQILSERPRHARDWKWPKLGEAYRHFFGEELSGAHSAAVDCAGSRRVYFHLQTLMAAAA